MNPHVLLSVLWETVLDMLTVVSGRVRVVGVLQPLSVRPSFLCAPGKQPHPKQEQTQEVTPGSQQNYQQVSDASDVGYQHSHQPEGGNGKP
jgi:hypothetical protein